jgi:lipoate-protein ligase A
MERDRNLLEALRLGAIHRPALRTYRWQKPSVSLGINQRTEEAVVGRAIADCGYDLVRRPTGGRALLHKGDFCYAIVARRAWHPFFKSLSSSFRNIAAAIVSALQSLGLKIPEVAGSIGGRQTHLAPCFALVSPFEVAVGGRKICGNAQYRSGEYFLQHGSIRVRDNWDNSDLNSIWPAGLAIDPGKITSIDRELGARVSFAELETELLAAFSTHFSVVITPLGDASSPETR